VTPTGDAISRVTKIFFSGSQSSGQGTLTYQWDFSEDPSGTQTAKSVSHVFKGACACKVKLTVTDPTHRSDTATLTVTSRKLSDIWTGQYSNNSGGFTVHISQGDNPHFDGNIDGGSSMDGTLSDPRHVDFAILNTPNPPGCQPTRSFTGTVNETIERIDATGADCNGASIGLTLRRQ
jgi:hypothetical protein